MSWLPKIGGATVVDGRAPDAAVGIPAANAWLPMRRGTGDVRLARAAALLLAWLLGSCVWGVPEPVVGGDDIVCDVAAGGVSEQACRDSIAEVAERWSQYPYMRECMSGAILVRPMDEAALGAACGWADPSGIWGCYWPYTDGRYVVVIRRELSDTQVWQTWQHELRHRASECATGDWDIDHVSEFFR